MNDSENKKSIHIHTGGLIIFIILIIIIFKVDIKSKITSPQFQKNITYIEDQAKYLWDKYLAQPVKKATSNIFTDITDKGVKELQTNVNKKLDIIEN